MDWQHPGVASLTGVLRGMDDEALAQLASTGLVRRARKDLAGTQPRLVVEGDTASVEIGGQRVRLAPLPAGCRCDCPAAGVCRHVLGALIFLRENTPHVAPTVSAREELLALDQAAVETWAGKALYRTACRALADGLPVEIEDGGAAPAAALHPHGGRDGEDVRGTWLARESACPTTSGRRLAAGGTDAFVCQPVGTMLPEPALTMTLPVLSIRCRWVTGAGLAGMLCSCREPSPCEHQAIAVLAFLVREGRISISVEESATLVTEGAVRSCEDLRRAVRTLLGEMVGIGLSRVSGATVERLQTLSVSAHAADIPRMERLLAALAAEAGLHVKRDSQSSVANLLALASKVEALACALAHPTPELMGQHRSRYLPLGECELLGAGARQWTTRSGYTGLTVYFWDPLARRWCTWSAARPVGTPGFSPRRVFDAGGPWDGCRSPREAAGSRLRLSGGWRSAAGRLSGRSASTAFTAGPTPSETLPAIAEWWDLRERALALFSGGLREFDERQEIVVLRPADWGAAQYDEVHQRLWRALLDGAGNALPLVIPYTEENRGAVRALEAYSPAEAALVLGLLRLVDGRLCVEPVSVIQDGRVLCLTLAEDTGQAEAQAGGEDVAEEWMADEPEVTVAAVSASGAILSGALADLEQTAETGLAAAHERARYDEHAGRCESLFLRTVAAGLRKLGGEMERAQRDPSAKSRAGAAGALLKVYYVASLAQRMETIEAALAPLRPRLADRSIPI